MIIQLDELINQVLEELKKLGMQKSTINGYQYSAYNPIRNYCLHQGTACYEPKILDAFLANQKQRLQRDEISERHYRKLRRAVLMLQDFAHYGRLQASRYSSGSQYTTTEYFCRCLDRFLEAQHLSTGTKANLKSYTLQFLHHLSSNGHSDLNTVSPKDVSHYLTMAVETHPRSMGNVLYALRCFFGYLQEASLVNQDFKPVLNIPAQRKKRILPCFTHQEVEAILTQINTHTKEGKRDYAILLLASRTGMRAIDIANLRLMDIDWVKKTIHLVQRKTGRPLLLPLETNTGNAMATYILEARPESDSEYVFLRTKAPFRKLSDMRSMGNILEKYRKKAGIIHLPGDGKSFHALRRSMGTWMLESGVPLTTISQVLGHHEPDSTKKYLSMDHERLAQCALGFQGIPLERGPFR